MKKRAILTLVVAELAVVCFAFGAAHAACTAIPEASFSIDGISGLNAEVINSPSPVTGVVDATGCDLGVYFSPGKSGSVANATVFGAKLAGIVNNGADVSIEGNSVYQIGDNPLDGAQYGLAIYVDGLNSPASGNVTHNIVWNFQKNGITIKAANSDVVGNTVIGEGPVSYIAQNGIEVGDDAETVVKHNYVFGMSYTGPDFTFATGVLIFGGPCFGTPIQAHTLITGNNLSGSDVGVASANLAAGCTQSVSSDTKNKITFNFIRNNGIFNTTGGPLTGAGSVGPYQAGVSDQGKKDQIFANSICGIGYTPATSTPPYLFAVDDSIAIDPDEALNFCFN
ncbi:MAG TPA: hypothetical protein VJN94_11780 [Candidatus Binataceae bacterium]|nr:hypothetical protein [Candidatus Binataceae bacterium]